MAKRRMIKAPTVFVVGAGASKPYGYHLGSGLQETIYKSILEDDTTLLDNTTRKIPQNPQMLKMLSSLDIKDETIFQFAEDLLRSPSRSIDEFLQHRHKYEDVGRASIAYILIQCETPHLLHENSDNWYKYLLRHMMNSCDKDTFSENNNNLNIITFNYDLSLEQFLFESLQAAYGLTEEDAATNSFIQSNIHHIHGTLPPLAWMKDTQRSMMGNDYGDKERTRSRCIAESLDSIIIPTLGEGVSDKRSSDMQQLIVYAKKICFIGFGYNTTNLSKIGIYDFDELKRQANNTKMDTFRLGNYHDDFEDIEVAGTGIDMDQTDTAHVKGQLSKFGFNLSDAKTSTEFLKAEPLP